VFGVFPRITAFEMLIVALMPAFLLLGWLSAPPATARIGSMFAIYISVQLALNSSYSGDFSSFANSSIALMLGIALTGVVCGIVRLLGASWIVSRLLRSNWRTLATVAESKLRQDRVTIASLMQRRLALLAARITVVPAEARSDAAMQPVSLVAAQLVTQIKLRNCCPHLQAATSVTGVRREKAALSSGWKSHPATAPAGSNRGSHGGNEVAEAFDRHGGFSIQT
jgi:uncharacterized membrane protein YccC